MWLFSDLPEDIIRLILSYDTVLIYRNGKYMNRIQNPDENYSLILERMRFQRYRRFYSNFSFVNIQIPGTGTNTEKEINYWATDMGLKITLFEWNYGENSSIQEKKLFNNR